MKATVLSISGPARGRLLATWRRAAPLASLGLLFVVGAGLGLAYESQQNYRGQLSSAVLERWARGGVAPLSQAILLLALWIAWRIARKAALFGAFLFVERRLRGHLLNGRDFRFAFAVQLAITLFYAAAATLLLIVAPFPAIPAPLISLGQAEAETLIGPLAPVAIALGVLIAYDFTNYWVHRAQHHFAILWRFHAVHHSVEDMDSLNSYTHPVDVLAQYAAGTIVGLAIGFTFETMLWFLAFQTIHDRLLHTRAPINFGLLGALLVDNRTHFLHHTRTEARSGKNFATTFTIFDRLFGTYQRPEAETLSVTGLEGQRPPATVRDVFLAKLGSRQPAIGTGDDGFRRNALAGGCRPSA